MKDKDSQAEVDLEFVRRLLNKDRSEIFNELVGFSDQKLNELIKMAERANCSGYAEQELLYDWEIKLLRTIARACNEILLARAMKFHIPS